MHDTHQDIAADPDHADPSDANAPHDSPTLDTAGTADAPASAPEDPKSTGARPPGARRGGAKPSAHAPNPQPVLEQLASFYPHLFGARFLPLKRGVFHDLMDAHPGVFEREALKAALSFHTRSTRYLTVVAAGQQRHDLKGLAVEAMAPEHVYQALLEVFRRRHQRAGEDVRPKLRNRIVQAFDASGLSRDVYSELVRSRDEAANAVLDEALAEIGARTAKDEALLRAFSASGQTADAFAEMYGMPVSAVSTSLERTRRARTA